MFRAHLRRGAAAGVVAVALLGPSAGSARMARAVGIAARPVAAPPAEASEPQGATPESAPPPASSPDAADPAGGVPAAPPATPVEHGAIQASAPRPERQPRPAPAPGARPRFLVGVAMGASVDAASSVKPMTFVVPAFAAELGFGDEALGFDIRLLSNQASGRAADSAPDRLTLDLLLALRPWVSSTAGDLAWGQRVLRALTLTIGLGGERLTAGPASALRAGLVVGARAELPLTAPAGRDEPGELRLRLAVRRLVGGSVAVGSAKSSDSTEVLAGPVVVF